METDNIYDKIVNSTDSILRGGGKVQRSFFKNVDDIVNKKSDFERPEKEVDKFFKNLDKILKGEKDERNR